MNEQKKHDEARAFFLAQLARLLSGSGPTGGQWLLTHDAAGLVGIVTEQEARARLAELLD